MIYLLTTIHILACLILVAVVLLQTGKRADLAGAFGGGGSQTAFGARGAATFLSKATTGVAVLFMLTSITLAIMSSRIAGSSQSVLEGAEPANQSAPAPAGDSGALPPLPTDSTDPGTDDGTDSPAETDDGAETPAP
jgi:preprotein translocase subunit SecG